MYRYVYPVRGSFKTLDLCLAHMYISTRYVKVYLRILLKLSEALNIYKVQLRFICVRQKLIRSRFALAHLCNWYLSCCIAVLLWLEKSISGSYRSFGQMKWWFVLLHIFCAFSYIRCYTCFHTYKKYLYLLCCQEKEKKINYKKKKRKTLHWRKGWKDGMLFFKA